MSRGQIGIGFLLVWAASAQAGDVDKGRQVAQKWCARCHVIGADRPAGGIDSTPSPSFFVMHDKLEDYRARIVSFDERGPTGRWSSTSMPVIVRT